MSHNKYNKELLHKEEIIKGKITIEIFRNTFSNGDFNFNAVETRTDFNPSLELSNTIFDTKRKLNNYLKRYNIKIE